VAKEVLMITFDLKNGRFNYRVAAVIIRDNKILLHVQNDVDYWTLPGGRCEFGESSETAIRREVREELNTDCTVETLLWVVENFFQHEGKRYHEISFYYKLVLPETCAYCSIDNFLIHDGNTKVQFRWRNMDEISSLAVKPSFLRHGLKSLPSSVEHIIHND
jgi:ADP-ribose pyrophosphatase YjhB (NUDIX family)